MKKYIIIIMAVIITAMSLVLGVSISKNIKYTNSISIYDSNFKALTLKSDSLKNQVLAYKFDIEQLEYINDSIVEQLNNTRKELKIKDKNIEQMQYILSEGNIKDSVYFKDTVFRDNFIQIDTTLGDDWYTVKLEISPPNKLAYNIQYKSELEVFMHTKKEYVGVPKKCAIGRMFQKKYKTTSVTVVDNNPYAEIKKKNFIFINK